MLMRWSQNPAGVTATIRAALGKMMHSFAVRWQRPTGRRIWDWNSKPTNPIDAVVSMSMRMLKPSWLLVSLALPLAAMAAQNQPGDSDMQVETIQKQMSPEQQAELFHFAQIGLQWVTGRMSFEEVKRTLGEPKEFEAAGDGVVDYAYFPKDMMVDFVFDNLHLIDGKPRINYFSIKIDDHVHTNIPYSEWASLGLHRIKRGELIDGVRTEERDFFVPTGILDISRSTPKNYATFAYRWPMSPDSTFDVTGGFSYLGEWINENREPTLDNFRNAVDLRDFGFGRHYLTPDELQERNEVKRQKFGDVNFCTGMTCPISGLWEGWANDVTTNVLQG
jgi:hypothetical protein